MCFICSFLLDSGSSTCTESQFFYYCYWLLATAIFVTEIPLMNYMVCIKYFIPLSDDFLKLFNILPVLGG